MRIGGLVGYCLASAGAGVKCCRLFEVRHESDGARFSERPGRGKRACDRTGQRFVDARPVRMKPEEHVPCFCVVSLLFLLTGTGFGMWWVLLCLKKFLFVFRCLLVFKRSVPTCHICENPLNPLNNFSCHIYRLQFLAA